MIQRKKFKGELGKGTQRNSLNCKIESTRVHNIQEMTKLESSSRKINMWLREVSERESRKIQRTATVLFHNQIHTSELNWCQLPAVDGERRSQ